MEEAGIEASLETYKQQLAQVEMTLQALGEDSEASADLVKLRSDLRELIQLTEESLLSLKKSKLMALIDGADDSSVSPTASSADNHLDAEFAAFQAAIGGDFSDPQDEVVGTSASPSTATSASSASQQGAAPQEIPDYLQGAMDEVVGMKCRVRHIHEWGEMQYHNALVSGVEPFQDLDDIKVRVVFCNPTHRSMVPCPYFLDGKCRFTQESCRYSHGYLINLSDLEEFQEPDYSFLELGSKCLCKYEDGIWYEGVIVEVEQENHRYTVHFESYDQTEEVGIEDILPLGLEDDSSSSDSDEGGGEKMALNHHGNSSEDEDALPVFLWRPPKTLEAMGEWEAHTKGIGSKLMAKMGYVPGQGLGKDGEGRAEPVPIQLLPPGKSLDKIMELKEKAGNQDLFDVLKKEKRRQRKLQAKKTSQNKKTPQDKTDVFGFINKKLHGKRGNLHDLIKPSSNSAKDSTRKTHISHADMKKKSDKHLNVQLLQTHDEMKNVQKEIIKLKSSLERNKNRGDKVVTKQIENKLASMESYLDQLRSSEKSISQQQQSRKDHKKLTVF